MLYHTSEWKGCRWIRGPADRPGSAVRAEGLCFGVPAPALPDWIEYFRQPDSETFNRIYNEAAIYLGPSLTEGWGAHRRRGDDLRARWSAPTTGATARWPSTAARPSWHPWGDAAALAERILRLIGNDDERIRIARAGTPLHPALHLGGRLCGNSNG